MLTVLLTSATAMAQDSGVRVHGNVYGGGNLADVKVNTEVNIGGGKVEGNVFGGGRGTGENSFACEKAMVGTEVANNACENPGSDVNKDKGTKVTISNGTVGTLVGEEGSQTLKEGTGNVYGGGEIGRVEWNTQVRIGVGTGEGTFAPVIYGSVFGAGKGLETHGYSALVRGNSTVTVQGNAKIGYNVYGGGEKSTVGRYWVKNIPADPCYGETKPTAPGDLPDGMPYQQRNGGICSVTIQGNAEIGYNGAAGNKGHVFGAGKGVEPHFVASGEEGASKKMVKGDENNPDRLVDFTDEIDETTDEIVKTAEELYLEFLQTLALVTNSHVTIDGSAKVKGNVYGGSESGFVQTNTTVTIQGGKIGTETEEGNVFGGGKGLASFAEAGIVKGNTQIEISGGTTHGNVYGGGELGDVGTHANQNPVSVGNYIWKDQDGNTISDKTANDKMTGVSKVSIIGGTIGIDNPAEPKKHGNVYGGGEGAATTFECEKAMVYRTNVSINTDGTVKGNVYGGGQVSRVEENTVVTIGTASGSDEPTIEGSVFAAGAGIETHGYSALVRGTSTVTVQGSTKVKKNVYGGGEKASVGRYKVKTPANASDSDVPATLPYGMPARLLEGGTSTVNIRDGATIGTENNANTGHVYGAGQGLDPYEITYTYDGADNLKPKRMVTGNTWEYFASPAAYLQFVETLALSAETYVIIGGERNESTGDITSAGSPTIRGSVFGGSESGFVYHDTDVNIQNGTINGSAFGGGRGLASYSEAGRVRGNTELTIINGTIQGNVYGGGNMGDVGTIDKRDPEGKYNYYWKNIDANGNNLAVSDNDHNYENTVGNNTITTNNKNTGVCTVTISGGTIGISGPESPDHGNVYGAGRGSEKTWWCEKAMAFATNVNISAGTVYGKVYGGGEIGRVEDDVKVTIGTSGGADEPTITGSVFGAGKGLATHGYSALVRGNSDVTIQGKAKVGVSVYGGGEIATVGRYVVVGGVPTEPNGGGNCTVTVKDDAVITEDVFGAGQGVDPATYCSTGEDRSKRMMVYNPEDYTGESGTSTWAFITTYDPSYEGTKFVWEYFTEAQYRTFLETLALASDTEVTVGGTTTGKTAKVKGSVYGGSESGFLQRHAQVKILNNCEIGTTNGTNDVDGYVFGGGKGIEGYAAGGRVSGYTHVSIGGGTMHGSVYGGGENGIVKGGVNVDMTSGTVNHDVYGGGALADTNTGNGSDYIAVPGITAGTSSVVGLYEKNYTYTKTTDNEVTKGKTYYVEDNSEYVAVSTPTNDNISTYYERFVIYTELTSGTAVANKTYYTLTHPTNVKLLGGTIKGDAYGGGLGDKGTTEPATYYTAEEAAAYNSEHGLSEGQDGYVSEGDVKTPAVSGIGAVEAKVYGDINVNLGSNGSSLATSFWITYDNAGTNEKPVNVVKSGRVFGCNNLLGSPQGNVTVEVWTTVDGKDSDGNTITKTEEGNKSSTTASDHSYRLAAVYGGGNLAPYTTEGKKTHVIIHGCSETSIETVYGGGNAAPVPETDVDIFSCYEIGSVFGGGNGKDKYTTDGGTTWSINPGANINGHANTMIYGGTVHEAYGGSNEKGTIYGDVTIDVGANVSGETCTLDVGKLVGAGKNADVNGSLKIIMGCKPNEKIPLVFGGADNANVNGDVELTVTSGNFGTVVGGNNAGGAIRGHIILNIEETTCIPLNIDNLYLCGYNAAYSQYGYYVKTTKEGGTPIGATDETADLKDDKLQLIPRESATDSHLPVKSYSYNESGVASWEVYTGEEDDIFTPYPSPILNVTSCTSIGEVFGGGYGTAATVYGNPVVNINMIPGAHANKIDRDGVDGPDDSDGNLLGAIGDVYGGGDAAAVYGNTTVNIGTETKVQLHESISKEGIYTMSGLKTVTGAYITGNVYGGGKLADVGKYHEEEDPVVKDRMNNVIDITGNTNVNICAKLNTTSGEWESVTMGTAGVIIGGSVYGGGKGTNTTDASDVDFYCAKAMVLGNKDNNNGGTFVRIGNGTVGTIKNGALKSGTGNVYGGGEISRVEQNTSVTIGFGEGVETGTPSSAPDIKGTVFGAGAGLRTHGYSALVRGHSFVTIEGNTKIEQSVYGGGELATVGRYNVVNGVAEANISGGACTVVIGGYAEIGPDNMKMNNSTTGKPDDYGHVFGAGMGTQPYDGFEDSEAPWSILPTTTATYTKYSELGANAEDAAYIKYIKTLALATMTEVTIKDHAFVKGSVYGGSENGFVQQDTHVTIKDNCQIGNGFNTTTNEGVNRRYTTDEWAYDGSDDAHSLPECAHWTYDANDPAPYDKYAIYQNNGEGGDGKYYYNASFTKSAQGGAHIAKDGHTFFGNVMGGGSGYYPYKPGRWFKDAGAVYGNTIVDITGGHILSNVYGGNELTDVTGTCTINMSGGTVGVPRTEAQMQNHPVTCNVFGAGMGDPRAILNNMTKVKANTSVNISGTAHIYGSTYGGGETGDVEGNTEVNVCAEKQTSDENVTYVVASGSPTIGGNVFGGGKGVANTFTCAKAMIGIDGAGADTEHYPDGYPNGTTTVRIFNGTVGTLVGTGDSQTLMDGTGNVYGGGEIARVEMNTNVTIGYGEGASTGTPDSAPEIKGSVFGGGAGLNTHGYSALVRGNPTVIVQGNAKVRENVYGGGEIASVARYNVAQTDDEGAPYGVKKDMPYALKTNNSGFCRVTIQGNAEIGPATIGEEVKKTNVGHVFGAGKGILPGGDYKFVAGTTKRMSNVNGPDTWEYFPDEAAYITFVKTLALSSQTNVTIDKNAKVKGSVFGGSESGFVQFDTEVNVTGGTIGTAGKGGADFGNVYGGGKGDVQYTGVNEDYVAAGIVKGKTTIRISETDKTNHPTLIYHNIYGGGAYGTVGEFEYDSETGLPTGRRTYTVNGEDQSTTGGGTEIYITSGTIGTTGKENGMIFGSSRGDVGVPNSIHDKVAWVYDANVTIGTAGTPASGTEGEEGYVAAVPPSGPEIKGSVYGSGENGHTFNNTVVTVNGGTIGIYNSEDTGYSVTSNGKTYNGAAYPYRGNVYGGGCGTDKYYSNPAEETHDGNGDTYNPLSGIVYGNTTINITGGTVVRNVYGAGAMGSVGKRVTTTTATGGLTTINVSGGTIGVNGTAGDGNVFGAARGDVTTTQTDCALVQNTIVNIFSNAYVKGSVYGGGETGDVVKNTVVNMSGGIVCRNIFGGGLGVKGNEAAGMVKGNTTLYIYGGTINGSVYGGGALSKVVGSTDVKIGKPYEPVPTPEPEPTPEP